MKHTRAAAAALPLALCLSLSLSGCGGDDTATKAGGASSSSGSASPTGSPVATSSAPTDVPSDLSSCLSDLPTDLASGLPTDIPSDLAGCLPTGVPTELPTDVPSAGSSQVVNGALDACTVVTAAMIRSDFGADPGQTLSEDDSFGDPNAKDCYFFGGPATVIVQATTRADKDMPADSYSYEGLEGAQPVPGTDRGWAYILPGQTSDTITSTVILVKKQVGLDITVSVTGHPYRIDTLQKFAADVLAAM